MMRKHLTAAALAVVLGAGRVSAQTPAPVDSAAAPSDDQAASELREHHRHHHHGGITQFIAMSLDTLGEDDAERPQIEKFQHELHGCLAPAGKVEKSVLKTISLGVAAGSIDAAKVDAAIGQLGKAADAVHSCSVETINKLHKALSPAERQALADKVQAHWQVWRQVNHEAEVGGLNALTKELSLTPDQVSKMTDQLRAALAPAGGKFDPQKAEEHMQAFASAFTSETFDAKSVVSDNGKLATHGAKRMALFYETVTPLLTKDQCAILSAHLREHSRQQPSKS
jgi:Spy/CpxP family protein refolding chaperone